jgi:hypothetical protein
MRYLLVFMLVVAVFVIGKRSFHFGFFGVEGKGPVKTETRAVTGFHGVDMDIAGDVEVSVADNFSVEVSAQENLLPILKTDVENGILKIHFEKPVSNSKDIIIRVSGPNFDKLAVAGSGDIKVMTPLKSDKLTLDIAGSGNIESKQLDAGAVVCEVAGSGNFELGGKANSLEAQVAGSGDVKGKGLSVINCTADISGSGSVSCGEVSQKLKATVSGSGEIHYGGTPSVESHVSGSGSVDKL